MVINIFESLSIDEFVDWLDEHCTLENSPWIDWFDKTYCKNCEPETSFDGEMEFSWCESHNNCRFFQDKNDIPDIKEIIRMWLESECE